MEAALRAQSLGHRVSLFETGESLGGQLAPASVPGSKAEIRRLLDYYRSAVNGSGISVRLQKKVDLETIKAFAPDQVILAIGAAPVELGFNVEGPAKILQAVDVLREEQKLSGNIVIIGGGPVGLDAAEYLVDQGATVTVLEMQKRVGGKYEWNVRKMKISHLQKKGISPRVSAKVVRVGPDGVVYADSKGIENTIKADFVVLATGMKPRNRLEGQLQNQGLKVIVIGDGKEPRGIAEAIAEGFEAALEL